MTCETRKQQQAFCFVDEEQDEECNSMVDAHSKCSKYAKVCCVIDSGAADHVTSREMAPHMDIKPSHGSQRGQHYVAANGGNAE